MFKEKAFQPSVDKIDLRKPFLPRYFDETEALGMSVTADSSGYARVIHLSNGVNTTLNSAEDALNFLTDYERAYIFTHGKDGALDQVLKWLGRDSFEGPNGVFRPSRGYDLEIGRYSASYIPWLGHLTIKDRRTVKHFASLDSFYHMSDLLPAGMSCTQVKDASDELLNVLRKFGIPYKNLTSPGTLFQGMLASRRLQVSRNFDERVLDAANDCYRGGWIDAIALGYCKNAYDYDISSAYSFEAGNLISCSDRYGDWTYSKDEPSGAEYGFIYGTITVAENSWSPILVRMASKWDNGRRLSKHLNGWGQWKGWVTKGDKDYIESRGIGKVEVDWGWWFVPSIRYYPFADVINWLLSIKSQSDPNSLARSLMKIISVASQGKFISTYYNRGVLISSPLYNPVFASTITSRVRAKVADFCAKAPDDILHIGVDGVLTSREVDTTKEKGPGAMRLSHQGEAIVVSDGAYWMKDKSTCRWLRESLDKGSNDESYRQPLGGVVKIHEGFSDNFDKVGTAREPYEVIRVLSAAMDSTRVFVSKPSTCKDLLHNLYPSWHRMVESTRRII